MAVVSTCYEHAAQLGGTDARLAYRRAQVEMELDSNEEAVRRFREAAAEDPAYAPIAWRLGFLLLKSGELDAAEVEFRRALEIDDKAAPAWTGLARTHLERGEHAEAVEALHALLQRYPRDSYARHLLSSAYRGMGKMDAAQRELERSDSVAPAWVDPWNAELSIYTVGYKHSIDTANAALQSGKFDVAAALLEEIQRGHPDDVTVKIKLGACYLALRRAQDALVVLQEAYATSPDRYDLNAQLANAYRQAGEPERGLPYANRAVELNPGDPQSAEILRSLLSDVNRR